MAHHLPSLAVYGAVYGAYGAVMAHSLWRSLWRTVWRRDTKPPSHSLTVGC
jgi:hypothetical protein